jgi:Dual specificity phosphatase, catalytic domain
MSTESKRKMSSKSEDKATSDAANAAAELVQSQEKIIKTSPRSATNSCSTGKKDDFDFDLTEGQARRELMADCEVECSRIMDNLYVSGATVARDWEILSSRGITRIVNCAANVVENFFIDRPNMRYMSMNMLDGRIEDVSWFLGDVIHFVDSARKNNENVLVHCERGVSRSCAFVIAYHMWLTGT